MDETKSAWSATITEVWVPGHPKTKGSMEHIGRVRHYPTT